MPHHDHHHHDHHGHDHTHGQDQHCNHSQTSDGLSFSEKLSRLLAHWIRHNANHAEEYRKWARDARENGQEAVAGYLESAAGLTDTISRHLDEAGATVKP